MFGERLDQAGFRKTVASVDSDRQATFIVPLPYAEARPARKPLSGGAGLRPTRNFSARARFAGGGSRRCRRRPGLWTAAGLSCAWLPAVDDDLTRGMAPPGSAGTLSWQGRMPVPVGQEPQPLTRMRMPTVTKRMPVTSRRELRSLKMRIPAAKVNRSSICPSART